MRALLIGTGRMGTLIAETLTQQGDEVVQALDEHTLTQLETMEKVADVVIDFSSPNALKEVGSYIRRTGTALVSGVTGYTQRQQEALSELAQVAPVLWSANYSLGVAVMTRALQMMSPILAGSFDIEVTEAHHNQKVDAPSGTAKLLLSAIDPEGQSTPVYGRAGLCGKRENKEIGVHSLRGGTVAGTHTVHFFGQDEELSLTHRATSRQIFVNGAVHMAHLMAGKPAGSYDIQTLLFGA